MDYPSENWIVANVIGIAVYLAIYLVFDKVVGLPVSPGLYVFWAAVFMVFAIVDFYVYHKSAVREEKKSVAQQLRDMLGTMGGVAIFSALCAAYILYERRAATRRLAKVLKDM